MDKAPATLVPEVASEARVKPVSQGLRPTTILVGINIAVFVGMVLTGVSVLEPTTNDLVRWGADWGPLTLSTQPWRLLTSNYVHIGVIHLFFNMWCLWSLGALAERVFERGTYVLIYTLCGLAGSCVSVWWHPGVVGAGASGAIFGVAGALLAALYLGKFPAPKEAIRPTLKSLLWFAGFNLFYGLRAGVDNSAHVGGLVSGLALGAIFSKTIMADAESRSRLRNMVAVVGTTLVLLVVFQLHRHHDPPKIKNPEDYFTALDKAMTAFKSSDYQSAIHELQIVVSVDPRDAEAYYLLGSAYMGAHQPDDAVESFQHALRLKPNYADAEAGLGSAYSAKGMNAEAQAAYKKAAELKGQ